MQAHAANSLADAAVQPSLGFTAEDLNGLGWAQPSEELSAALAAPKAWPVKQSTNASPTGGSILATLQEAGCTVTAPPWVPEVPAQVQQNANPYMLYDSQRVLPAAPNNAPGDNLSRATQEALVDELAAKGWQPVKRARTNEAETSTTNMLSNVPYIAADQQHHDPSPFDLIPPIIQSPGDLGQPRCSPDNALLALPKSGHTENMLAGDLQNQEPQSDKGKVHGKGGLDVHTGMANSLPQQADSAAPHNSERSAAADSHSGPVENPLGQKDTAACGTPGGAEGFSATPGVTKGAHTAEPALAGDLDESPAPKHENLEWLQSQIEALKAKGFISSADGVLGTDLVGRQVAFVLLDDFQQADRRGMHIVTRGLHVGR